jgi:hypothetical protein
MERLRCLNMSEGEPMSAIELEWFIRKYIPRIWVEPIERSCFIPRFNGCEFLQIMNGGIPDKIKEWYYIEAIRKWQKLNNIIVED